MNSARKLLAASAHSKAAPMSQPQSAASLARAATLALLATIVLAAMVLAHAWRVTSDWTPESRRLWLHAAYATHAAIAILSAAWVAFGPGRLSTRFSVMLAWMLLLLLLPWQVRFGRRQASLDFAGVAIVSLGMWLGALTLMAAARHFGIRLTSIDGRPVAEDRRNWQFSILGLLAVMTEVALAIAIFRSVTRMRGIDWELSEDDAFWLLARILNSLLVASTVITCFHVPRPWWRNVLLAGAFVGAITSLHVAAIVQYSRFFPMLPVPFAFTVWGLYYGIVLAWLVAAVGLLEWSGYSLRRCNRLESWRAVAIENVMEVERAPGSHR